MFGSTILDVVLGLVFVYFLLSLIASQANEMIARMMKWRSKDLEEGIRNMLLDDKLAARVWGHPLIAGTGFKPPESVPSGIFVVALIDAVMPSTVGGSSPALQMLRTHVNRLPEGHVKNQLVHIVDSAGNNMTQARAGIESWFNASMERVSAEYKKQMQLLTLFVAFAISLVLGVDTLHLANSLWREPVVRAAIAGFAQPRGPTASTILLGTGNTPQEIIQQLADYNLPIGWSTLPQGLGGWVSKVVGLFLTTLAVSLGAPFWFDLLRALNNLRNLTSQTRTLALAPPAGGLPTTLRPAISEASKPIAP